MISRHIPVEPENDNYGRLVRYLARIGEYADDKEPPAMTWCAGYVGGDDYAEGIAEVQDTQALNTRVQSAKTYHLVVSFRPEDQARLTPEASEGSKRRTRWPMLLRKPAVSAQFSPLMSSTILEPSQARSVGRIRPAPLPERVGAKTSKCSGPLCRRYSS